MVFTILFKEIFHQPSWPNFPVVIIRQEVQLGAWIEKYISSNNFLILYINITYYWYHGFPILGVEFSHHIIWTLLMLSHWLVWVDIHICLKFWTPWIIILYNNLTNYYNLVVLCNLHCSWNCIGSFGVKILLVSEFIDAILSTIGSIYPQCS